MSTSIEGCLHIMHAGVALRGANNSPRITQHTYIYHMTTRIYTPHGPKTIASPLPLTSQQEKLFFPYRGVAKGEEGLGTG